MAEACFRVGALTTEQGDKAAAIEAFRQPDSLFQAAMRRDPADRGVRMRQTEGGATDGPQGIGFIRAARPVALGLLKRETSCPKGIEIKRIKCAGNDEYRDKIV